MAAAEVGLSRRAAPPFAKHAEEGHRGLRTARVRSPEENRDEDVSFKTSRMKLALVGGVHPVADSRQWTVVARNGAPTRVLKAARLYPFTKAGNAAAVEGAVRLRIRLGHDDSWRSFRSRVLVEGPWERPEAVIPVWVIEGLDRPIPVEYYFD